MTNVSKGILLILSGAFWFALMSAIGKLLTQQLHPLQIVFLRNAIALSVSLFFLPAIASYLRETPRKWTYLARGAISQTATSLWFLAVGNAPFLQVNALSFLTPFASAAMAVALLNERVSLKRWAGLGLGLLGVLWVLRPDLGDWHLGYGYALGCVFCWGIVNVAIKSLATTEPPLAIVFAMFLTMTGFSLPGAWLNWRPLDGVSPALVLALGGTALLWQVSITFAYRFGTISEIQPFEYTRLVFSSLFASILFRESMDGQMVLGTVVVLASGFIGMGPGKLAPLAANDGDRLN